MRIMYRPNSSLIHYTDDDDHHHHHHNDEDLDVDDTDEYGLDENNYVKCNLNRSFNSM